MSFGQQEYQHRFYKPIKARAGPFLPTLPVYYPPQGDYEEYLYNSLLLDSFKRSADYNRDRKRFHSNPHNYIHPHPYYDSLRRLATETPFIEAPPAVVYLNREAPEVLPSLAYSAMASRLREAEREAERAQAQAAQEREQMREYRHKYERLKSRLREEMGERRLREAELRKQREAQLEQEKEKIDKIGQTLMQMSQQVSNNSRIMQQNLRLREQAELGQSKLVVFPTIPSVLSSSMLVDRPTLESQYRQMKRLKKQIGQLDRRLGYTPTPP